MDRIAVWSDPWVPDWVVIYLGWVVFSNFNCVWTRKISSIGNVTTCDKVTNWHIDWLEILTICHSRFKFLNLWGRQMSHRFQGRKFNVHDNAVKCGRGCGFIFRTIEIFRFPTDHSGFRFDVRGGISLYLPTRRTLWLRPHHPSLFHAAVLPSATFLPIAAIWELPSPTRIGHNFKSETVSHDCWSNAAAF